MGMERGYLEMKEKGFTLIEVMIALIIFSIGALSIAGMFIIGEKGIKNGMKSFMAVQAAKAQMEILRHSDMNDSPNDNCSTLSLSNIQCTWSIKKDTPEEGLSLIEVIATWFEGEKERELVLTTIRFDGNN